MSDVQGRSVVKPFLHYSDKPLPKKLINRRQRNRDKPRGLWISYGNSWAEWCKNSDFFKKSLKHRHYVVLKKTARIIWLRTPEEIDEFTKKYSVETSTNSYGMIFAIDWKRIAKEYQGIVIAPYVHQRRLAHHTLWYYTWDVASGCVWDMAAIERITLIKRRRGRR